MHQFSAGAFLEGRKNEECFKVVLKLFAGCVVGQTVFKRRLAKVPTLEEDLWTASDEGFLHLAIENAYDRWEDLFKCESTPPTSLIETKYTLENGRKKLTGGQKCNVKGWTRQGMARYNDLVRAVQADRRNHPRAFREWYSEEIESKVLAERETSKFRANNKNDMDQELDNLWGSLGAASPVADKNQNNEDSTEEETDEDEEDERSAEE